MTLFTYLTKYNATIVFFGLTSLTYSMAQIEEHLVAPR